MTKKPSNHNGVFRQALPLLPMQSIGPVGSSLFDSPTTRHLVPALLLIGLLVTMHLLNSRRGNPSS